MHLHPSKEVDLERKVKYLLNLMSDINEKKIDHNTYEILRIKKKDNCLCLS